MGKGVGYLCYMSSSWTRIVSLLPAATDWLVAFGAGGRLVGRSHLCDAPEAAHLPVLTHPAQDALPETADAIDRAVRATLDEGLSPSAVNLDALRELRPDVVVTQTTCGVCAPSAEQVEAALDDLAGARLVSFSPSTSKEVLDAALRLAREADALRTALPAIAGGEQRLAALAARLEYNRKAGTVKGEKPPRVLLLEWPNPPMSAGHWTPDLVKQAGGAPVLADAGSPSRTLTWEAICAADPDVLLVAGCGRTVRATLRDLVEVESEWRSMRAVREERAFVLDAVNLVTRPGPQLARTAEVMARCIHELEAEAPVMSEEMGLLR